MVATLKTTVIQDPSSATANLTLDASGGVSVGQNLSVTGTTTFTGGSTFTGNATAAAFIPTGSSAPTNGLFLPAANSAGIATNSVERLRIDSSGNVGVGTSSPGGKLHVVGTAASAGWLVEASTTSAAGNASGIYVDASNNVEFAARNGSNTLTLRLGSSGDSYINSGNLGIGTSSPTNKLTVNGGTASVTNSTYAVLLNLNDTVANNVQFGTSASDGFYIANTANLPIRFSTNSTERLRITSAGGVSFGSSGTAYGTAGQVLTSAGNAPPTWSTISATGALIRAPQILTSGTSYTTPSNCTKIYVEATGGGGGGGKCNGGTGGAAGGGGGAYCAKYFTVTGSTSYTYAIGSGGTGKTGATGAGSAGGNTTFTVGATTITAAGGSGGPATDNTQVNGGSGGTATNGDLNITGGNGGGNSNATTGFMGGTGGSTVFGAGAGSAVNANNGSNGNGYGGGGGGGGREAYNGGNGSQGMIRIWEFT